MKHPFTIAMFTIAGVLVAGAALACLVWSGAITLPAGWGPNPDDGAVVDGSDDGDGSGDITPATSDSGNVTITSPQLNEIVGLPLVIKGQVRVFENTFNYRLLDSDGSVLVEGHAMANAPDIGQFGDFTVTTSYPSPKGTTGTVEVFDYSAKDGSVIDLAQVPVEFPAMETMNVKLYFATAASADDCSTVGMVEHRVPKSVATAYTAITELLRGPDTTDQSNGYSTIIPQFTALKSIALNDGVLTAEFSSAIEGGGSCRVSMIRKQIESTLKQYPTITSVVLKSEGKTPEESLQP